MLNTEYKLRHYSPWKPKDFDTVRLEISVGQEYHEGNKLKTATEWARQNFERAVLIVGDTVQGYNIASSKGLDLQTAFDMARVKGDEWLERNREAIEGLEITRWDDWLAHPHYAANHQAVLSLYESNKTFLQHIDQTIEVFRERRQPANEDGERFTALSRQFLLEETAVFATAYKDLGGISAYPGSFLETWQIFINQEIEGAPEGLKNAHWTRLQFRRRVPKVA